MLTTTYRNATKSLLTIAGQVMACLACWMTCPTASAQAASSWVFYGTDNRLHYQNDANGNHIMDFSYAGYGGGGVALPIVAVAAKVSPSGADDTAAIQAAINQVAALTPNANGFRGAVLLAPGNYTLSSQLILNTSGVVLRGSGSGSGGTVLTMSSSASPFNLFSISGTGSWVTGGSSATFTDPYVPSGAMSFNVTNTSGFSVGQTILVQRPVTQAWIDFMGMCCLVSSTGTSETWISAGSLINTDRTIAAINGSTITLDAPLTDSFDATYLNPPGGAIIGYTFPGRVAQIGIEHLAVVAPAVDVIISSPQYTGVTFNAAIDCWLSDVGFQDTQNTVQTNHTTKRVTFDNVHVTHTVTHTGDRMADFGATGTQLFFNECSSDGTGEWPMVTQGEQTGPVALVNFESTQQAGISAHQRWATGLLADNCSLPNAPDNPDGGATGISFSDRGNHGSGQGWAMGWGVAWNVTTPYLVVQQPPGAANWCIGCIGQEISATEAGTGNPVPNGYYDSLGTNVTPHSLYLAQLLDRLGSTALANINYPLNTALPTGWSDTDVGAPSQAGSATYAQGTLGTFTVNGGGTDIWSTSDNFHYAYEPASGNTTAIARVATQPNTSSWAKSGVMFRETTAANSAYVFVLVTPSNGVSLQYRSATGATAASVITTAGPVAPYWLKLVRSSNTFTGYSSVDGANWTQVGSISVTMASNATVGLAVTAHSSTALNTSTFDHVSITQATLPPAAAPTFSPAAGTYPGAQSVTIGTTTSGATIRYTTDGSTPSETNGTVYAGPVTISATTTLQAIAYESGFADSPVTTGTYTIQPITDTITASAGSGGSISPSGSVTVNQGSNQTFTITPNSGFAISSVTVDGTNAGAVGTYTFSNVQANHTISAAFAASASTTAINDTDAGITYTGTWSYSANRNLGDYQNDIHYTKTVGNSFSYTFNGTGIDYVTETNTDEGNVAIYIDGTLQTTVSCVSSTRLAQQVVYSATGLASGSHTLEAVMSSGTYMLLDELIVHQSAGVTFTIAASAGTGGTISPSGSVTVNQGANQTFTIAASSGYSISSVTVDGTSVGAVASYTFSNVQANHTLSAAFAATSTNIAPAGTGTGWFGLSASTATTNQNAQPGLNDGNLTANVDLDSAGDAIGAWEAAGVIWSSAHTISSADFINGDITTGGDGFLTASLKLQFTTDGVTWSDSGWTVSPAYPYGSSAGGQKYTFSGTAVSGAVGARFVGQVRTTDTSYHWIVKEVQFIGN